MGKTATPEKIKRAYRKLARKYHPDLNPRDKSSEAKFKDLNKANEVLFDPEKRQTHDRPFATLSGILTFCIVVHQLTPEIKQGFDIVVEIIG